jgi:hypothetical protein
MEGQSRVRISFVSSSTFGTDGLDTGAMLYFVISKDFMETFIVISCILLNRFLIFLNL